MMNSLMPELDGWEATRILRGMRTDRDISLVPAEAEDYICGND